MSEENKELTLVQKVKKLENAVLKSSPEEVARVYAEVDKVELSARALGYAFRYRGVEYVKALVEGGASLKVPFTNYMINTYGTYGDDYSVMLLDNFPEKGIMLFAVTNKIIHSEKRADGAKLEPLPFEKRLETVKYLCEYGEKAGFVPGDLLYFAILFRDERMTAELKKLGVELPEYRKKLLTDKGKPDDLRVLTSIFKGLPVTNFASVLSRMAEELGGEKFHNTKGIYKAISDKLYLPENLKAYLEYFDEPTPNKTAIMKSAIDNNLTESLVFFEQAGWLKQPGKRDEMIEYSTEHGNTECTAWLLDFKNRTADFAEEQVKADKKQQRELNASPDSVSVLRTLWSYRKREDGTIIINGYKGSQLDIVVPAKIGKSPVTAIGEKAFSPFHNRVITKNGFLLQKITSVTLPDSITEIGEQAFDDCYALRSVNIPKGVTEIKKRTFSSTAIENIILPDGLKTIGDYAFFRCGKLRSLAVPEGVTFIGLKAIAECWELETVELPCSIEKIDAFYEMHVFSMDEKLTAIVPSGSYAEEYCKEYKIHYVPKGE